MSIIERIYDVGFSSASADYFSINEQLKELFKGDATREFFENLSGEFFGKKYELWGEFKIKNILIKPDDYISYYKLIADIYPKFNIYEDVIDRVLKEDTGDFGKHDTGVAYLYFIKSKEFESVLFGVLATSANNAVYIYPLDIY